MDQWRKILDSALRRGRVFSQRHWQRLLRIRERIRFSEESFHLLLAGVVGVMGGVVNVAFYLGVEWAMSTSLPRPGDIVEVAQSLAPWQRLLIPSIGGLLAGLVLYWGLRLAGPEGPSNILEVVVAGNGRLWLRGAVVKAASSLVSIATGASIGREGSITQLSATVASAWGQRAGWQPYRLRLLVACGAASGIAATYNAPVAGAVFAAQIVLGNFAMNLFAPLVFSSVVATMVSRSFFGMSPLYAVPPFEFTKVFQLGWFLVLGVLSGAVGAAFLKILRYAEMRFDQLRRPVFERIALAGVMVGALAIFYPEVWGNGYSVTNRLLHEDIGPWVLVGLFLAKLLATSASVGAGTVGGVFTPTLFLGAALGCLLGKLLHMFGLAVNLPEGAFGLVGMGSVLSATVHSPLLALIMVFEISLNYSVMPPLMVACVVASLVARRFHPDSIYTEPLRRKGLRVSPEDRPAGAVSLKPVGEMMRECVQPLLETDTFRDVASRFLTGAENMLPVTDQQGRLVGVVDLLDMKEYLTMGAELAGVIALDVMRPPPPCLTPDQTLEQALPLLLATDHARVLVVHDLEQRKLAGVLIRSEALGLLSQAIAARTLAL